jgi:histidinol dehydrogenase
VIPIRRLGALSAQERAALVSREQALPAPVVERARQIIERVRLEGDAAVNALSRELDGAEAQEVPIGEPEIPAALRRAIDAAHENVAAFHEKARIPSFEYAAGPGTYLGAAVVPYERAGVYVPGGRATYPSTVVMAATPAKIAGVGEIVLVTPNPTPAVRYAARRCGVGRIFRVGGAQAIAALAFGTATIPRADIIVGPGNAYVSAAKKLLSDRVAIDFVAGPTEILILWDGTGRSDFVAIEMAAQAEHDADATAVLVTPSGDGAAAVVEALRSMVPNLERAGIITAALSAHGQALVAESIDAAVAFANDYAPEHLLLMGKLMEAHLSSVRTAGAVSSGAYASVALADYGSGPNHILPTMGHARRASALSVQTFLRVLPYQRVSAEGLRAMAASAIELARAEGLGAHARAIELRLS